MTPELHALIKRVHDQAEEAHRNGEPMDSANLDSGILLSYNEALMLANAANVSADIPDATKYTEHFLRWLTAFYNFEGVEAKWSAVDEIGPKVTVKEICERYQRDVKKSPYLYPNLYPKT